MKYFNWFYNITGLIFLNVVICGEADNIFSTKGSSLSIEQDKKEFIKELFDIEDFANFNNSLKEVNLMIKGLEHSDNVEKFLNYKLLTISKILMDHSSKISKSSSDRNVILECLTESICLIDIFIPYYNKKKETKHDNIFLQSVENIIFKLKDLHFTLYKVTNKQQLNLTKFNSIKSELKNLEKKTKKLIDNYLTYLDLLNDHIVFYNYMDNSLVDLKIRFKELENNISSMEENILKEESASLKMAVGLFAQPLSECFSKNDEKLDCMINNLENFVKIIENLKILNDKDLN